jgi:tRNA(fMet)-specific endonuclease VapC
MTCPLVLDANALISLFDGSDNDLEQALCRAEVLVIPIVSYAEVMAGADSGTKRAMATLDALARLLSKPNTRLLPVSEPTVRHYCMIFNLLKRNGTPIPTNDIWIASATMECGGRLFTHDKHFLNVPMLDTLGLESPA